MARTASGPRAVIRRLQAVAGFVLVPLHDVRPNVVGADRVRAAVALLDQAGGPLAGRDPQVAVDLAVPECIHGALERIAEIVDALLDLFPEVDLRAAAGVNLPVEPHHDLGHRPGALAGSGVVPEQRFMRQVDPILQGERFGLQDHFVGELLVEEQGGIVFQAVRGVLDVQVADPLRIVPGVEQVDAVDPDLPGQLDEPGEVLDVQAVDGGGELQGRRPAGPVPLLDEGPGVAADGVEPVDLHDAPVGSAGCRVDRDVHQARPQFPAGVRKASRREGKPVRGDRDIDMRVGIPHELDDRARGHGSAADRPRRPERWHGRFRASGSRPWS